MQVAAPIRTTMIHSSRRSRMRLSTVSPCALLSHLPAGKAVAYGTAQLLPLSPLAGRGRVRGSLRTEQEAAPHPDSLPASGEREKRKSRLRRGEAGGLVDLLDEI